MTVNDACWAEMTAKQLDEALHVELGKNKKDKEKIIGILRVLEEREMKKPPKMNRKVRQAFRQYKRSDEGTERSRIKPTALKIAAVAAVFCLVLFAVPPMFGKAFLFETIATWTDEVFRFTGQQNEKSDRETYVFQTDHPGLQEIYDTVRSLGVTDPVVPMWLPDGYHLTDIKTLSAEDKTIISAFLESSNGTIFYLVDIHTEELWSEYTKEKENVKIYERAGYKYYVFANETELKISWCSANAEYTISIIDDNVDIYRLIDSIHGG